MMTEYFDTHAHLSDARFDEDRDEVIASKLPNAGVTLLCEVACDLRTADKSLPIIENNSWIYGAFGMHPHYASFLDNDGMDRLAAYLSHEKAVALGEIGLDYHYDSSPREQQRDTFDAQLCLAEQLGKPIVLHIREAMGDCMDILRAHRQGVARIGGIMHCFSGSYESAKECLSLGLAIGIGGSLTFKNARKLIEVAENVPMSSIVLETDCPYMAPVPFRGERNDPSFLPIIAQKLAEIKGISPEEAAAAAYENGLKIFNIKR